MIKKILLPPETPSKPPPVPNFKPHLPILGHGMAQAKVCNNQFGFCQKRKYQAKQFFISMIYKCYDSEVASSTAFIMCPDETLNKSSYYLFNETPSKIKSTIHMPSPVQAQARLEWVSSIILNPSPSWPGPTSAECQEKYQNSFLQQKLLSKI